MYNPDINYLIGIDFGHGETTASILKIKTDLIKNLNECISRELSSPDEVNEQEDLEDKSSENTERKKSFSELISDIKKDSFGSIENLPIHGDDKTVKSAMTRLYTIGDDDDSESEKSEWFISPSTQDIKDFKEMEDPNNGKYFEFLAYFKGPLVSSKDIEKISHQDKIAFGKFIEAIMKEVNKKANEMGAYIDGEKCNCIIYAACPSTWTEKQKDEYQRFLKKSGVPCKEVLYESDAAYMSIRNTINEEGIKDNLLVVDLGSSSIDFTWYGSVVEGNTIRPQEPVRGGNPKFGASQVEEKLVSYMKVKEKKTAGAAYAKLYEKLPNYADSILEYAVRMKKEEWFKRIKAGNENAKLEEIRLNEICYGFSRQDIFGPDEDANGNPQLYRKAKIEDILKDFKDELEKEFVKFRDRDDVGDIKYVMLTGSASKMYFVAPLAETVFGVSKKDKTLIDDNEAEFTVSKGAAKFGLYKYLSDPLGEEIKNLIDKTWGNYDWVKPVVKESIKMVTQQVYKELLYGVIDQWSDKKSNIVAKEDHNLNEELSIICKEVGTGNSVWDKISNADPLVAGYHSIHAVLREIFDYIEMANDKTRDAIDKKVSEALTDEINQKVGVLFKKYISVYLNDRDYSGFILPTFYKVSVDIDSQMQHDLLKKLIEFTYNKIPKPRTSSLNKNREDVDDITGPSRSKLNPTLKRAINDFVECIGPKFPEKEISEACMKSVDAKFKEIEAICEVEVYRLSDQL